MKDYESVLYSSQLVLMSILIRFENNVTQCVSDQFNVHFLPCACCCWVVAGAGGGRARSFPPASCAPLVTRRCSAAAGAVVNKPSSHHCPAPVSWPVSWPWNNGKEVPRLDHAWTANTLRLTKPALPLISCPHSLVWKHGSLLRDSFSVTQQPPIWEPPSHHSMEGCAVNCCVKV